MNVFFLKPDELSVESELRGINPNELGALTNLQSLVELETNGTKEGPNKMHQRASKRPDLEIENCRVKLEYFKSQIESISELSRDVQDKFVHEIESRLLHVLGRLERATRSNTYEEVAKKALFACTQLIASLQPYLKNPDNLNESIEAAKSVEVPSVHDFNINTVSESVDDKASSNHSDESSSVQYPKHVLQARTSTVELSSNAEETEKKVSESQLENQTLMLQLINQVQELSFQVMQLKEQQHQNPQPINVTPVMVPSLQIPSSSRVHFEQDRSKHQISPQFIPKGDYLYPTQQKQYQSTFNPQQPIYVQSDQRLSRSPSRWNVSFDGSPGGSSAKRFIFKVEHLANADGVPHSQLVDALSYLLKGNAAEWYWNYLERNFCTSWDTFKSDFIKRFQDRRSDLELMRCLESRHQKNRESFYDFYNEILSLSLMFEKQISDSHLMNILRQNMRPGLQDKLTGLEFGSIDEMVRRCVSYEDTWSRTGFVPELLCQQRKYVHELDIYQPGIDHNIREKPQLPIHDFQPQVCAFNSAQGYIRPKASNPIDQTNYQLGHPNVFMSNTPLMQKCWNCLQVTLVHLADTDSVYKNSKYIYLKRTCNSNLIEYWNCMDRIVDAIAKGSQWFGRSCCSLAYSPRCQNACTVAGARTDIQHSCRQSDEQNFFSCLERQEIGDKCCGNARTSECLQACRDIFKSRLTPSLNVRNNALRVCNDSSIIVNDCIKNLTDSTTVGNNVNLKMYLPCCNESNDQKCRSTCKKIIDKAELVQEAFDHIQEGGCGPTLPYDPLWQCFLSSVNKLSAPSNSKEISRINQIGIDSAKLHCCQKAIAPKCKRLCISTYSSDWTVTRDQFEEECLGVINEINLKQCVDEVDEPCELGCDGLSFCTNFNNRPLELFRSCNNQADMAALSIFTIWKNGMITLPNLNLPVRNTSQCSPEMWKAIACSLQIKPCTRETHANQICREDCYDLLSKCLDWTRIPKSLTVPQLCKQLSIDDTTTPCISLKPFLEQSDILISETNKIHITSPCRSYPCNSSSVCKVNRYGNDHESKYTCHIGCPLGETSPYMVPVGTYVRIPVSSTQKGCLNICRCGSAGKLEKCQPLPCITYDSCNLGGKIIEHSQWFYIECNVCSCFAGEITCTKKQCHIPGSLSEKSYTSLPCNCPPHYVPVCAKNGMTYPSSCIAKCVGLQDTEYEFGTCRSKDPCLNHNCHANSICVRDYQVCLSTMHKPCLQYQCINLTNHFCQHHYGGMEKVCSNNSITQSSICHQIRSKSQLKYYGPCIKNGLCNADDGDVCGINGITYNSECEAWSENSAIDYHGSCREIGLLSNIFNTDRCHTVSCKTDLDCLNDNKIIPPGACCPICGSGLSIVYSRKQIDRALYALNGYDKKSVTLKSILKSLENLIQIRECRLIGYLTIETDLFVSVIPINNTKSKLLQEVCQKEIEKISTLIRLQSHRVQSELGLSALTVSNIVDIQLSSGSDSVQQFINYNFIVVLILFYII